MEKNMKKNEHICITKSLSHSAVINTTLQFNYWCVVWPLNHVWLFSPHGLCSLPGFSVHGISQARIPEWVAISSSNWPSQPRDWTSIPSLAGRFFTTEPNQQYFSWGWGGEVAWDWFPSLPCSSWEQLWPKISQWRSHKELPFPLSLKATAATCRQGTKCECEIHH